jgi:hypothetical protein
MSESKEGKEGSRISRKSVKTSTKRKLKSGYNVSKTKNERKNVRGKRSETRLKKNSN